MGFRHGLGFVIPIGNPRLRKRGVRTMREGEKTQLLEDVVSDERDEGSHGDALIMLSNYFLNYLYC